MQFQIWTVGYFLMLAGGVRFWWAGLAAFSGMLLHLAIVCRLEFGTWKFWRL
jgi:hypothetical protein